MGAGYVFCPSNKLIKVRRTLKVVSESRVTWATSMPILVFLGLSVLDLRPDVRDRQTDVRRASSFNASALCRWGHNKRIHTWHLYHALLVSVSYNQPIFQSSIRIRRGAVKFSQRTFRDFRCEVFTRRMLFLSFTQQVQSNEETR